MTTADATGFKLGYVPGVTPAKWARVWQERLPRVPLTLLQVAAAEGVDLVRTGAADAGLVRLPFDRTGLHAIPLYTEATVVVVPKEHLFTAAEEVTVADLAGEYLVHPLDDTLDWTDLPGDPLSHRPATTAAAAELVAAGAGVLVVPQSLARLNHRRDLTYLPLTGDEVPQSRVALIWPEAETTDLMEQLIGIVRGRTANSSRQPQAVQPPAVQPQAVQPAKPSRTRKQTQPPRRPTTSQPRRRGRPRRG